MSADMSDNVRSTQPILIDGHTTLSEEGDIFARYIKEIWRLRQLPEYPELAECFEFSSRNIFKGMMEQKLDRFAGKFTDSELAGLKSFMLEYHHSGYPEQDYALFLRLLQQEKHGKNELIFCNAVFRFAFATFYTKYPLLRASRPSARSSEAPWVTKRVAIWVQTLVDEPDSSKFWAQDNPYAEVFEEFPEVVISEKVRMPITQEILLQNGFEQLKKRYEEMVARVVPGQKNPLSRVRFDESMAEARSFRVLVSSMYRIVTVWNSMFHLNEEFHPDDPNIIEPGEAFSIQKKYIDDFLKNLQKIAWQPLFLGIQDCMKSMVMTEENMRSGTGMTAYQLALLRRVFKYLGFDIYYDARSGFSLTHRGDIKK